jgi:hypothetical protein
MIELHLDNQGIPERLHPKSYHAMFSHNTNVWASRQHQVGNNKPLQPSPAAAAAAIFATAVLLG